MRHTNFQKFSDGRQFGFPSAAGAIDNSPRFQPWEKVPKDESPGKGERIGF
jgi:hypothetical protein